MQIRPAAPVIASLSNTADATAFREINEEWISRMFSVTTADRATLADPQGNILDSGGDVLIARTVDGQAVGAVALLSHGEHVFELSKMGVTPHAQGGGIGRALVTAALERAAALGARRVFLGTNSRLETAIHLYEAAGFRRINREQLPVSDYYARADILMEIRLPLSTPQ